MRMARLLPILLFLIFLNLSLPVSAEPDETYSMQSQALHRPSMRRAVPAVRELQVSRLDRSTEATDTDLRPHPAETLPACVDRLRVHKIPAAASRFDSPSEED